MWNFRYHVNATEKRHSAGGALLMLLGDRLFGVNYFTCLRKNNYRYLNKIWIYWLKYSFFSGEYNTVSLIMDVETESIPRLELEAVIGFNGKFPPWKLKLTFWYDSLE